MARQTLQPDTTRQASAQAGALPVSGQIWNNLCGLARSKTLWGVLLLAVLWGYGYAMNPPAVDMDDLAIATYQQGGEFLRQGRITVWLLQALTGIMTYQRFWPELFFALSLVLAGILLAVAVSGLADLLSTTFPLRIAPDSIILSVVCSSLIGTVFGFVPARNAARLNPIEALARE